VDVADAGYGAHRPLRAENDPALIDQRLIQPAAEHLHRQQPARRHAANHAAEFVHVGVDHHAGTVAALRGDDRAEAVEGHRRRERLHQIDQHLPDRFLESRRAGGVGELLQQRHRAILGARSRGNRADNKRQNGHERPFHAGKHTRAS
jgi:hypothetical protein